VSALLLRPRKARAVLVLAHGAGAGMTHPFLAAVAEALAARGVATLRFQFPYMQRGSRRPDRPATAHATLRAVIAVAAKRCPTLPLFAGGKSFGGRMTSQLMAQNAVAGVRGVLFIGFPLHPAKQPSITRAEHLKDVAVPMLFVQGSRDALADWRRLSGVVRRLGSRATLVPVVYADHGFHVPAYSGRTDEDVIEEIADAVAAWIEAGATVI